MHTLPNMSVCFPYNDSHSNSRKSSKLMVEIDQVHPDSDEETLTRIAKRFLSQERIDVRLWTQLLTRTIAFGTCDIRNTFIFLDNFTDAIYDSPERIPDNYQQDDLYVGLSNNACAKGNLAVVKYLEVDRKVDPNFTLTAFSGDLDTVKYVYSHTSVHDWTEFIRIASVLNYLHLVDYAVLQAFAHKQELDIDWWYILSHNPCDDSMRKYILKYLKHTVKARQCDFQHLYDVCIQKYDSSAISLCIKLAEKAGFELDRSKITQH